MSFDEEINIVINGLFKDIQMSLIPRQDNWRERDISEQQMKYLEILQGRLALGRQDVIGCATRVCKRFISDVTNMKQGEASDLIDYLREQLES